LSLSEALGKVKLGGPVGMEQRDTEGSERSKEAEWARVSSLRRADLHVGLLLNFNVGAPAAGGWKRDLRRG
jgi:hypothetical protein